MSLRHIALLTAAIVAFGGTIAIADPSPQVSQPVAQVPDDMPGPDRGGWLRDLNLTSEQLQKIQQIRSQRKGQLAEQRQTMRQAMQELRQLMAGNAPTEQIRQKYNEVRTLRMKLADAQFNDLLSIREVLTPEQRRKFADHMQRRRENWKNRMQNAPGEMRRQRSLFQGR
jgi:Spy/CpxP family protein refolding chaperone